MRNIWRIIVAIDRSANFAGRWILRILFAWAIPALLVSLTGSIGWTAAMGILPILIAFVLTLAFVPPARVALGMTIEEGQEAARALFLVAFVETAFCVYLAIVPVASYKPLIPLLLLTVFGLIFAGFATPGKLRDYGLKGLVAILVIMTIIFFIPSRVRTAASNAAGKAADFTADALNGNLTGNPTPRQLTLSGQTETFEVPYYWNYQMDFDAPVVLTSPSGRVFRKDPDGSRYRLQNGTWVPTSGFGAMNGTYRVRAESGTATGTVTFTHM